MKNRVLGENSLKKYFSVDSRDKSVAIGFNVSQKQLNVITRNYHKAKVGSGTYLREAVYLMNKVCAYYDYDWVRVKDYVEYAFKVDRRPNRFIDE